MRFPWRVSICRLGGRPQEKASVDRPAGKIDVLKYDCGLAVRAVYGGSFRGDIIRDELTSLWLRHQVLGAELAFAMLVCASGWFVPEALHYLVEAHVTWWLAPFVNRAIGIVINVGLTVTCSGLVGKLVRRCDSIAVWVVSARSLNLPRHIVGLCLLGGVIGLILCGCGNLAIKAMPVLISDMSDLRERALCSLLFCVELIAVAGSGCPMAVGLTVSAVHGLVSVAQGWRDDFGPRWPRALTRKALRGVGVIIPMDGVDVRRARDANGECVICRWEFADGDVVADPPCGHAMHDECANAWFEIRLRCPACLRWL
jgi:hypothetical protein